MLLCLERAKKNIQALVSTAGVSDCQVHNLLWLTVGPAKLQEGEAVSLIHGSLTHGMPPDPSLVSLLQA